MHPYSERIATAAIIIVSLCMTYSFLVEIFGGK